VSKPVSSSPIAPAPPVRVEAGWEVSGCRSEAALTITDCTPLAKVHLRAPWNGAMAKALGVPFGRASREGGGGLLYTNPSPPDKRSSRMPSYA
jgi:sarcosine oxidase subunit gamma